MRTVLKVVSWALGRSADSGGAGSHHVQTVLKKIEKKDKIVPEWLY